MLVWILLALNLVAATAAACHAAMYKRDPRAAWGWLLSSFAVPILGPLLYWLLGVKRIRRRRIGVLPGVGPPVGLAQKEVAEVQSRLQEIGTPGFTDLVHLAHRVTSQPLLAGNFVEPLRNGEEAYPAMLAAIEGARGSVNLATYIFDGDGAGKEFVLALSAAADRGVEVRVLVDSFGEWYSKVPARRLLRKTRVRTAKFAPPLPCGEGHSSIFGATGRSSSSTGRWASRAA